MKNDEKIMVFDLIEKLIEKGVILRIEKLNTFEFKKPISYYHVYELVRDNPIHCYAETLVEALTEFCYVVDIPI